MKSKYNGYCKDCGKAIHKGDEITNRNGKWVHEVCPNKNRKGNFEQIIASAPVNTQEEFRIDNSKPFVPSKYQKDVFDFIVGGKGHAVIEAVAGSGKTTTIVKALEIVPKNSRVAFLAFNRHIAKELKSRSPENVHVSTLHSLGLALIKKLESFREVEEDKLGIIMDEFWGVSKELVSDDILRMQNRIRRAMMRRIVSLCKGTLIDYKQSSNVLEMAEHYGIVELEEGNIYFDDVLSRLSYVMDKALEMEEIVDFEDMIWMPVVHKRLRNHTEKFNYLFVDEAQDLNACQMEFVLNSIYPGGRIIAVGDRRQSLYGFRGADTEAIPNLISRLGATVLPLSISYRCPKLHVNRAKSIVPQIEASENAIEGKFGYLEYDRFIKEINPGDMVICRTNAPLVKPAFEAIRSGKKAIIRGKDIGQQLVNFIERFQAEDLSNLEILMAEYTEKEYQWLLDKGKELAADMVVDKLETIRSVSKECKSVAELIQKLEILFSDSNVGVVFSSVHRAKGLEAERVYVLKPELMPHPKAKQEWEVVQEDNTLYVAITRSKNELYYVTDAEE